jgi:hypothetical protein
MVEGKPQPWFGLTIIPLAFSSDTPAASRARCIACRLFAIGMRLAFSKSRIVLSETCARFARSSCDQSNQPRAARLCSGDNMMLFYRRHANLSTPTIFVGVTHISGYHQSQRKALRLSKWRNTSSLAKKPARLASKASIRLARSRLARHSSAFVGPQRMVSPFVRNAAASIASR